MVLRAELFSESDRARDQSHGPGWRAAFDLSPRLNGLSWAKGTVATVRGPLAVRWKATDKTLDMVYTAPEGVKVVFARNDSMTGLKCVVNGGRGEVGSGNQ